MGEDTLEKRKWHNSVLCLDNAGGREPGRANPWGREESDTFGHLTHTQRTTIPRQLTFLNARKTGLLSKVSNELRTICQWLRFYSAEVAIWRALEDYKLPIKRQIELAPVSSLADRAP